MSIALNEILDLVGKLDDSPGDETPRERFRQFLQKRVVDIGQVRDYIEECLRNSGPQYNRALQDLVNYLGQFLGFDVEFGRYQGVQGEIGFDGHWSSSRGFHFVIEVKTSEAYSIKTSTLLSYIDQLISAQKIPSREDALGLYVIGRMDPEIRQLENAIFAEKRTHRLRISSVDSLLSLAEMMNEYDVDHEDILAVIRPSRPTIDPIVELMASLVAQSQAEESQEEEPTPPKADIAKSPAQKDAFWLTPVASDEEQTGEEVIQALVGNEKIYAFGERTPGRKHIQPDDWICFYASGKGVVGHARITSVPKKEPHPKVRHSEKYPWVFHLDNPELYLEDPVVIDGGLRSRLEAFEDREPDKSWAWFVQSTRKISEHDFRVLTRQGTED